MNLPVHAVLLTLMLGGHLMISCTAKDDISENSTVGNAEVEGTTQVPTSTLSVLQKWEKMEQGLKTAIRTIINSALPKIMDRSTESNVSGLCIKNVMKLIVGLRDTKTWAISFFDSSAKTIDGMLSGSTASFGSFDQCINTEVINERRGKQYGEVLFRGQYCALDIKPPLPPKKKSSKLHIFGSILDEFKNFSTRGTAVSYQAKYAQLAYYYPMRLGICVPSGCTAEDLGEILQEEDSDENEKDKFYSQLQGILNSVKKGDISLVLGDFNVNVGTDSNLWALVSGPFGIGQWGTSPIVTNLITMTVKVKRCQVKEENQYSILQIVIISVFGFVGLLVLSGTLMEHYICYMKQKFNNLPARILLCFSFTKNIKEILNTKSSSSDNISCLNGFRFLSVSWVIFGHTYFFTNYHIMREALLSKGFLEDFAGQVIINTALAVDTFFCIGGLLLCYHNVKKVKTANQSFSVPCNILRRIFRIHPPYLFVIALVFICPLMGSGPVWHDMVDENVNKCCRNWWMNVLFINNFFSSKDTCLPHTWYIAADMQLYIVALFVLIPILKWPKVGLTISLMIILFSMIASAVVSYVKNFPPTMMVIDLDQMVEYAQIVYNTSYAHAGPYFIGFIVGYFLATKPKVQIPKIVQIMGWFLAVICSLSVVYGIYGWSKGNEPTSWEIIFFSGCHKTVWCLGVAWVIFCCENGYGGVVNHILSWKAWVPLGQLTYFAYLLHPIVMILWMASSRQGIQMSHASLVWIFFGHVVATFGISLATNVVIESPFMSLQKIIFRTEKRKETTVKEKPVHELNDMIENDKFEEKITVISISKKSSIGGIENNGFAYKA